MHATPEQCLMPMQSGLCSTKTIQQQKQHKNNVHTISIMKPPCTSADDTVGMQSQAPANLTHRLRDHKLKDGSDPTVSSQTSTCAPLTMAFDM
jgi:hypothetical protein